MKVVQINCSSGGSTGNIAKAIHKKLIENGNESYIFFGVGNSDDENIQPVSPYFFVRGHALLSKLTGLQGYFSYFFTKKLLHKIKTINPDVIHLHNLHGSYLCLPTLFRFLKQYKGKIVITLHDCWLFTGKCPHFTEAKCYKWKTQCEKCPQLAVYPRSCFFDRSKKMQRDKRKWLSGLQNTQIITVSDWLKKTAEQSFLSSYSIKRIYNGINEKIFYPRNDFKDLRKRYNVENDFVILGVSSNWNEQKGLGDFYKLSKLLQKDEKIILVGLTPQQIENLPPNIIGITRTENQDELARLYSMADVFVNMSIEETFGLVTAEAMACGTLVIVYDSTACGEIVTKDTGFVLPPHMVDRLYETIKKIKLSQKNNNYSLFTEIMMITHYLRVYRGL